MNFIFLLKIYILYWVRERVVIQKILIEKKNIYKPKIGNPVLSAAKFFTIDAMWRDTGLPITWHV